MTPPTVLVGGSPFNAPVQPLSSNQAGPLFAAATAPLHRRRVALADVGLGDEVNARVAGAVLSVPPYL